MRLIPASNKGVAVCVVEKRRCELALNLSGLSFRRAQLHEHDHEPLAHKHGHVHD